MSPTQKAEKTAGEYGREAFAHWGEAIRLGAKALSERKQGGDRGGDLGELANAALARFGKTGKLAAKAGVGRRVVDKLLPAGEGGVDEGGDEAEAAPAGDEGEEHLFDETAPMPIQESIDIAVPVAAVFDLCTRFEELDRFSERISEVRVEDDSHFALAVKIGARQRKLAIEVVGEEPEERLDWEAADGFAHAGVVSFHPLAPRLTRVELSIEPQSESAVERMLRLAGLPERAIRQELRRFKAYAELWDEANDYRSADFKDPGTEAADEEAAAKEEPEEEEPEEEEPEEEEPEDEEPEDEEGEEEIDEEAEEPLEEEEPEPAAK